jgi:hypothetical protein
VPNVNRNTKKIRPKLRRSVILSAQTNIESQEISEERKELNPKEIYFAIPAPAVPNLNSNHKIDRPKLP